MLTLEDLFKDGFMADILAGTPKCQLPCAEHEGETRLLDNCPPLKYRLPVEKGGVMDRRKDLQ